jgi:hypothetical protein
VNMGGEVHGLMYLCCCFDMRAHTPPMNIVGVTNTSQQHQYLAAYLIVNVVTVLARWLARSVHYWLLCCISASLLWGNRKWCQLQWLRGQTAILCSCSAVISAENSWNEMSFLPGDLIPLTHLCSVLFLCFWGGLSLVLHQLLESISFRFVFPGHHITRNVFINLYHSVILLNWNAPESAVQK